MWQLRAADAGGLDNDNGKNGQPAISPVEVDAEDAQAENIEDANLASS